MARPKRTETMENLEQQIEKAQGKVFRTKRAHETAVDELQKLLDKRDAMRKDELWKAIVKSGKSYDEILAFINTDPLDEEE